MLCAFQSKKIPKKPEIVLSSSRYPGWPPYGDENTLELKLMELRCFVLVLGLCAGSARAIFDYIPPIGIVKAELMRLSGASEAKVNEVLKKSSYLAHTLALAAESGVNAMDGNMAEAKKSLAAISAYMEHKHVEELRSMPNGIPVVGHLIAGVQAYKGDRRNARRTLESANSGLGSALGGAAGLLCGPAAMACVPIGALIGKTTVDGAYTLTDRTGRLHGNVDYLANLRRKDAGEHFDFVLGTALDAVGGRAAFNRMSVGRRTVHYNKAHYKAGRRVDQSRTSQNLNSLHDEPIIVESTTTHRPKSILKKIDSLKKKKKMNI